MTELIITSVENPTFKMFRKLYGNSSLRNELGQCLLDGPHLIRSYSESGGRIVELIKDASIESVEINELINQHSHAKTHVVQHDLFTKISDLKSVTGIIALIDMPVSSYKKTNGLNLLLDDIQDPGNLGSILRSAAATGSCSVFLSKGCSDLWSPKTLRGSQGAQFFLDCYENQSLEIVIDQFDFPCYTLGMKGESLYNAKLTKDIAIIIGNEGQGVNPILLSKVKKTLSIPMARGVESLNVSSAASIMLYEYYRQLQDKTL